MMPLQAHGSEIHFEGEGRAARLSGQTMPAQRSGVERAYFPPRLAPATATGTLQR
ncbi:hypothetical protein [Thermogemmatispora onikobensis]|uniref:hypothetical protein n=1 Tax=Thermogemmatispora onikobensis TaxID=732234 RepID=UPI00159EF6EE|nr:hypothetical protein [Thermogemmatispora onikobensis]